jgi:hypothetical protein
MVSLTGEDGTIITVAEGSWASVEHQDNPPESKFVELEALSTEKRKELGVWLAKVAAVAAAFPLGTGLVLKCWHMQYMWLHLTTHHM